MDWGGVTLENLGPARETSVDNVYVVRRGGVEVGCGSLVRCMVLVGKLVKGDLGDPVEIERPVVRVGLDGAGVEEFGG